MVKTSFFQVLSTSFCNASKSVKRASRKSHQEVFCKKCVGQNFAKFTGKHIRQSLCLIKLQATLLRDSGRDVLQGIFKNIYFEEHLGKNAYGGLLEVFKTFLKRYRGHHIHCVKRVRIQSFSGPYFPAFPGPYSVRMWENTDQKNFQYGHFTHSDYLNTFNLGSCDKNLDPKFLLLQISHESMDLNVLKKISKGKKT